MRVIAGALKGRKLKAGDRGKVRPTSDRVRTAIFNILPRDLSGVLALDLYAGAGALGIEAISRGAESAVFVDSGRESARMIEYNVDALGLSDRTRLIKKRVEPAIKILAAEGGAFDLIFMDPPYQSGRIDKVMRLVAELGILVRGGMLVAEHGAGTVSPESVLGLARKDLREYGGTAVSFYELGEE